MVCERRSTGTRNKLHCMPLVRAWSERQTKVDP